MGEQITLDAEFLRRALGQEGELTAEMVTPGTLPADFPITLPELAGTRVLGGIRTVARQWTFHFSGGPRSAERKSQTSWRAFLDVPAPQPEVMEALITHFAGRGWQAAQMFQQTFVEAARTQWMGGHTGQSRTLNVSSRQEGAVMQVHLQVQDTEPEQIEHLLGRRHHPHFEDFSQAPFPTLILPEGWSAQMLTGQGGPVRSETVALGAPQPMPELTALLSHFLPQLERQGWRLLHREDAPESLSVYRTPLGIGTLSLRPGESGISALIVHATAEDGRGSGRVMFSVGSS